MDKQDGACNQTPVARRGTFSLGMEGNMKRRGGKLGGDRVSITVHVRPSEAVLLDAAAALKGQTRHDLARDRLLGETAEDTPLLACLAMLLRLHHRLDRAAQFDEALRAEILALLGELTIAVRAEVAG